jgi:hypothetical protein
MAQIHLAECMQLASIAKERVQDHELYFRIVDHLHYYQDIAQIKIGNRHHGHSDCFS